MFTGIIKACGKIAQIDAKGGDFRLSIESPDLDWAEFDIGESIAVNGICLTAVNYTSGGFVTDVSLETMNVTALAGADVGDKVNLEPSLSLGERLGGHLVSGHVDCVGLIGAREVDARSVRLVVEIPRDYMRYVAKKGAICVDGVSLTVNEVSENTFTVNIIPHTADATIIGAYRNGTAVNIEVDLVARYLERLLDGGEEPGINKDFLREHGYV
ncbi:MAG: riboflavin synthase [Boseongicola sp.]